jgi:hypothetical protein
MRSLVLSLFLVAAAPAAAADGDSGRFTFVPAENGIFRLDTMSGEVSLCTNRGGALVCLSSPSQADRALAEQADRIVDLEARIAALEADSVSESGVHREAAIGRVKTLAERMMGRVFALVREMKRAEL